MTVNIQVSRIDKDKEENGVFVELPAIYFGGDYPEGKTPALKLAKWQNTNHQKAAIKVRKSKFPGRSVDDLGPEESIKLLREVMAESIVLDWRDVTDIDGADVPYSKQACMEWMEADRDLASWVMQESQNRSHYYRERLGKSKTK